MFDFDPRHFGSTFINGKLNGFDLMIMESAERADEIIGKAKAAIDDYAEDYAGTGITFSFSYDDSDILPSDQKRIEREIKNYCHLRNVEMR